MLTFTIIVSSDAAVGTLEKIRHGLTNRNGIVWRAFSDAVDRFESYIRGRFDRLSRYGGLGQWPPLRRSTVRQRLSTGRGVISMRQARGRTTAAAVGGGKVVQILYETGKLRESLELTGTGHIRTNIPGGIRVGSRDRTIKYHQYGTRKMPARKVYVPPPPEVAKKMGEDVAVGVRMLIAEAAGSPGAGPR